MPIIVALSRDSIVKCSNVGKHGISKRRAQYNHFNAKVGQWQYWSKLSFAGKTEIANLHKKNGTCMLCLIDERVNKK